MSKPNALFSLLFLCFSFISIESCRTRKFHFSNLDEGQTEKGFVDVNDVAILFPLGSRPDEDLSGGYYGMAVRPVEYDPKVEYVGKDKELEYDQKILNPPGTAGLLTQELFQLVLCTTYQDLKIVANEQHQNFERRDPIERSLKNPCNTLNVKTLKAPTNKKFLVQYPTNIEETFRDRLRPEYWVITGVVFEFCKASESVVKNLLEKDFQDWPQKCTPRLRVVTQPLVFPNKYATQPESARKTRVIGADINGASSFDWAMHLVYEFEPGSSKILMKEMRRLKNLKSQIPTEGVALGIHPKFEISPREIDNRDPSLERTEDAKFESPYVPKNMKKVREFADEVGTTLMKLATRNRLKVISTMTSTYTNESADIVSGWYFNEFKVETQKNETFYLERKEIPFLPGQIDSEKWIQGVNTFVDSHRDVASPFARNNSPGPVIALQKILNRFDQNEVSSTDSQLRQEYLDAYEINNPIKFNPESLDCASCHLATGVFANLRQRILKKENKDILKLRDWQTSSFFTSDPRVTSARNLESMADSRFADLKNALAFFGFGEFELNAFTKVPNTKNVSDYFDFKGTNANPALHYVLRQFGHFGVWQMVGSSALQTAILNASLANRYRPE